MSLLFWENPGIQIVSGVSTVAIFSMKNAFQEMAKSTAKLTSTGDLALSAVGVGWESVHKIWFGRLVRKYFI